MAITRRQVERPAPGIEALCARRLDDVEAQLSAAGEADLVATFTHPLPMTVIRDLLGT